MTHSSQNASNQQLRRIPLDLLNRNFNADDIDIFKSWGSSLARSNVKMTQLRKFFSELKRIEADFERLNNRIIFLDPQLAYAAARADKNEAKNKLKELHNALSPLIRSINEDKNKYKRFVRIFEAIIAYHKAEGGES